MSEKHKINEVILHVGLHKTGEACIQETLSSFKNTKRLEEIGYIYPKYWASNHSAIIYSTFCDHPEEYLFNLINRYSIEDIRNTNEQNLVKLQTELTRRKGDKLIFSGEDISMLSAGNLNMLKDYLIEVFSREIKIRVIIYVRNPVSWSNQLIQEFIKKGSTYEAVFHQVRELVRNLFRNSIEKFIQVFGRDNIEIGSYEEAMKHEFGVVGHFLTLLGLEHTRISEFTCFKIQPSLSQVSGNLLSYVNGRVPMNKRVSIDTRSLLTIRGSQYELPYKNQKVIYDCCQEDLKWLDENLGIDYTKKDVETTEKLDFDITQDSIKDIKRAYYHLSSQIKDYVIEYLNDQFQRSMKEPIRLLLGELLSELKCIKGNSEDNYSQTPQAEHYISEAVSNFDYEEIPFYRIKTERDYEPPFVTIIVPNYNHAKYLRQRLESIYNQTYTNYEVILLDDCSEDESIGILEEYLKRYPQNTRLFINKVNSGGAFYQWEKGITLAKYDLIWIAESDDWCSADFLEELTKSFEDEAILLSYCQTNFMDEAGDRKIWTIKQYLQDINNNLWNQPFIMTAHQLVNRVWAIKNIIPNVSSALFRNPVKMKFFKEDHWKAMPICGDWAFYIYLVQGGAVAYTTKAINYYRIHKKGTSYDASKSNRYYKEHEWLAITIKQLYQVPMEVFSQQAELLKQYWRQKNGSYCEEEFSNHYNLESIKDAGIKPRPNILMVGYSFSVGGGETFPIFLANILKSAGYSITFLSCDKEKREKGIQDMLRKDIPIVNHFSNLYRIVVDFGINIIHSHYASVDYTIMDLLPHELQYFHIITLHGMYEVLDKQMLSRILPRLLSRTSKIVYTADKNLNPFRAFTSFPNDKFVKIANAFERNEINPVNLEKLGIASGAFVICQVSRAIPEKGWVEAIEIVNEARRMSMVDIQLILIGSGPEYDRLKECSQKHIHFLGFRDQIQNYFAASDLGLLTSRFTGESFPLALIACLHAGKPVLASDIGEIPKMLLGQEDLAGSVFPLEDGRIPIRKVAEIMSQYAEDKNFYQTKLEQVKVAVDKFSVEVLLEEYESVYRDAGI